MLEFKLEDLDKDGFNLIKTKDGNSNFIIYQCNEFNKEEICLCLHKFITEIFIDRRDLELCLQGKTVHVNGVLNNIVIDDNNKRKFNISPTMEFKDGYISIK